MNLFSYQPIYKFFDKKTQIFKFFDKETSYIEKHCYVTELILCEFLVYSLQ